jgi:hypothetical protein
MGRSIFFRIPFQIWSFLKLPAADGRFTIISAARGFASRAFFLVDSREILGAAAFR